MGRTQELIEAVKAGELANVRALVGADAKLIHAKDEQGNSAVLLAVYYGKMDVAEFLIGQGVELTIHEAAAAGKIDRVKALLAVNSDLLHEYSHDGFMPLHLAAFFGHEAIVDAFLSRGANVNAASRNRTFARGVKPIHSASARVRTSILMRLVESGADVNARDDDGNTALMSAAANGSAELVKIILAAGADTSARNNFGQSALDLARGRNHAGAIDLLESR
jgi:ankyrin repeat protein